MQPTFQIRSASRPQRWHKISRTSADISAPLPKRELAFSRSPCEQHSSRQFIHFVFYRFTLCERVGASFAIAAPRGTDRMLGLVRRRIPLILSTTDSKRAVDGLTQGLFDNRFEVRFQSGRALAQIQDREPGIPVDQPLIRQAVLQE